MGGRSGDSLCNGLSLGWVGLAILALLGIGSAATAQVALAPQVSGLVRPIHITHAGDGSGRLFVVEQVGRVRIIKNGVLLPRPLLDITDRVNSTGSEQGLLSIAFPPAFAQKQYFYVDYTADIARDPRARRAVTGSATTVVSRFRVSANPDVADAASEEVVLRVGQPFANHNGGQLAFSPRDGLLYIGLGDGGSGGDPQNNAQNRASLLGKILRIDVESPVRPYAIPADNPFRDELWALGLRNPWRFSFDRQTGDLYIGDVGQNTFEEVDFQPAASPGGENYGWRCQEGLHPFDTTAPCAALASVPPVQEYSHVLGCSVTGGFVYRGPSYPRLQGVYLYGDFCSGRIWGLQRSGTTWQSTLLLDSPSSISTFGEDEAGNLYLADYGSGTVHLVWDPAVPTADLRLTLADSPDPVVLGGQVTYSGAITNVGPSAATGVQLSLAVPASFAVTSATAGGASCTPTCALGTLAAGAVVPVSVIALPGVQGSFGVTATVTGGAVDPVPGNQAVTVLTTVVAPGSVPAPAPQVDTVTISLATLARGVVTAQGTVSAQAGTGNVAGAVNVFAGAVDLAGSGCTGTSLGSAGVTAATRTWSFAAPVSVAAPASICVLSAGGGVAQAQLQSTGVRSRTRVGAISPAPSTGSPTASPTRAPRARR